ncbi:hypothetical protein IPC1310_08335 [Pseudomonas aeruginosa]|nr:hypothetical protein IPC1310_08335 [Pseudomonas aeruginosa]
MPRIGKRSAQARKGRRYQGSKPNGRDSARGAGRRPRARRRNAEAHRCIANIRTCNFKSKRMK